MCSSTTTQGRCRKLRPSQTHVYTCSLVIRASQTNLRAKPCPAQPAAGKARGPDPGADKCRRMPTLRSRCPGRWSRPCRGEHHPPARGPDLGADICRRSDLGVEEDRVASAEEELAEHAPNAHGQRRGLPGPRLPGQLHRRRALEGPDGLGQVLMVNSSSSSSSSSSVISASVHQLMSSHRTWGSSREGGEVGGLEPGAPPTSDCHCHRRRCSRWAPAGSRQRHHGGGRGHKQEDDDDDEEKK
jgi:hypothetical protein